jgi:ABC-type Zn uptake system ZnuABC Zn-binding protein ZnuA
MGTLVAVAGCGSDDPADAAPDQEDGTGDLKVVTTVAPITDIVRQIAGDRFTPVGIVPDGADSHTFEPGPSVARELSDARLFIANGLFLEEPSLQLAEANLPPDGEIVTLADQVVTEDEWVFDFSFPESEGLPNPHLWTSPPMATEYARIVAAELSRVDPDGADDYQQRYDTFAAELDALDAAIAQAVETIPEGDRKLVTYHDSFPYFAPHYGFEIVGAVQPADFSEPSAREVADLIDQVRDEQVPAIFGSEVFPSDVLAQIADETGAEYVEDLRDDALPGQPGDPGHTYVGMMVFNVRTIVDALGGDSAALDPVDPGTSQ